MRRWLTWALIGSGLALGGYALYRWWQTTTSAEGGAETETEGEPGPLLQSQINPSPSLIHQAAEVADQRYGEAAAAQAVVEKETPTGSGGVVDVTRIDRDDERGMVSKPQWGAKLTPAERTLPPATQKYISSYRTMRDEWLEKFAHSEHEFLRELASRRKLGERSALIKEIPPASKEEVEEALRQIRIAPSKVVVDEPGFRVKVPQFQHYEEDHALAMALGSPTLAQWVTLHKRYGIPLPKEVADWQAKPSRYNFGSIAATTMQVTVPPGTKLRFSWNVSGGGTVHGNGVQVLKSPVKGAVGKGVFQDHTGEITTMGEVSPMKTYPEEARAVARELKAQAQAGEISPIEALRRLTEARERPPIRLPEARERTRTRPTRPLLPPTRPSPYKARRPTDGPKPVQPPYAKWSTERLVQAYMRAEPGSAEETALARELARRK